MRLIDIETARHSANHDHSAGPATAAPGEATAAFALHPIAKLLDPLLQLLFVSSAKVLRSSLCAADAYGLRRPFCSSSIQGKGGKIAVALASAVATHSAEAGISTGKRGERAVHRQTLKSAACRSDGREVAV